MQYFHKIIGLLVIGALFGIHPAHANLCKKVTDLKSIPETKKEIRLYQELFPNPDYHGSLDYNGFVLECNRRRDNKGDEVRKILTRSDFAGMSDILKERDLPKFLFQSKYKFFGFAAFKMRYLLSKENGVWKMVIPYKPVINDVVKNRIDFNMTHAKILYDATQVTGQKQRGKTVYQLKTDAQPIAQTQCTRTTFFAGKENKYDGKNGVNAHKRDKANKHISLGKIQYAYKDGSGSYWVKEGCRVRKNQALYWQDNNGPVSKIVKTMPADWILDNFERVAEAYWGIPDNFELQVLLQGHNENQFSRSTLNFLKNSDYLTVRFGAKFLPHNNQMYKANVWQPNNFSTMTTDGTYIHEVGHAFGLDDEYAQKSAANRKQHCEHKQYDRFDTAQYTIDNYTMCDGYGEQVNTIYHYIAVSRYVLNEICKTDADCGAKRYCNNRLGINRCFADGTKTLGQMCHKNRECASDKCEKGECVCKKDADCPNGKACYTPVTKKNYCASTTKPLGASCSKNSQCASDKCEKGECVCKKDADCPGAKKCKTPITKKNYCT